MTKKYILLILNILIASCFLWCDFYFFHKNDLIDIWNSNKNIYGYRYTSIYVTLVEMRMR